MTDERAIAINAALYAGLVVAQRAAKSVAKDSTNPHHGYAYASSEDMIEEARAALNTGGLAAFPLRFSLREILPAFGEGDAYYPPTYLVDTTYALVHEGGQSLEFTSSNFVLPEKGRPWDKALLGARTIDLAYALRGLLLLPRGDADPVDQRDDRKWEPRGASSPKSVPRQGRASPPTKEAIAAREAEAKTWTEPRTLATPPTPSPPAAKSPESVSPLKALWTVAQTRGWASDDVVALSGRLFAGRGPRQLEGEDLARLTDALESGTPPPRDNAAAIAVVRSAREGG